MAKQHLPMIPDEVIINKIYLIRGQKVMLDRDLAELYGVTTGNLNKAVKRNPNRFPDDFMFQLTEEEFKNLIFQNGTSSWGGTRKMPYAFTDLGVPQLSTVLKSEQAIMVNLQIMRVFNKMQKMLLNYKDFLLKIEKIEKQLMKHDDMLGKYDADIQFIFKALKQLLNPPQEPRKQIGFKKPGEE